MVKSITISGAMLLFSASLLNAQNKNIDSLSGFDEQAAIRASITEDFMGSELKIHLNQLKRKYINEKFSLTWEPLNYQPLYKTTATAACVNEDFEASTAGAVTSSTQISGWTVVRGSNQNGSTSCNLMGCCPTNPSEAMLISAPAGYVDGTIGSVYPIYSVFGTTPSNTNAAAMNPQIAFTMYGDNFIRINSNTANFSIERLSKTFSVTSANALFRFAFIAVQASGHACCDAGGFILRLTNVTTNSLLSAVSYSAPGLSPSCASSTAIAHYNTQTGVPSTTASNMTFTKWHTNYIDLTPYMGQNINIEVTSTDCTAGAHYGYSYFDSQCGPIEIMVNENHKNVSCTSNATVSAPANLGVYQWTGPAGFTSSAPSFTTNTPGVYYLTLPQNAPLQSVVKTLSLVISPASMTITQSKQNICVGEQVKINVSGLTNYSWSNNLGTSPSVTVKPNTTITYTLTGSNSENCQGFALVTVSVIACTGIEKTNETADVTLFPNPNSGVFSLNINRDVTKGEITITNNIGQLVHSQSIQKGENKIKTKGLSTGIYYFSITNNNEIITQGKVSVE